MRLVQARNKYPVNSIVLSDFTMASTEMEKQAATAQKQATQPRDVVPDIVTRRFDLVEKDIKSLVADAARLRRAWNQMDYNGNGKVSLVRWAVSFAFLSLFCVLRFFGLVFCSA